MHPGKAFQAEPTTLFGSNAPKSFRRRELGDDDDVSGRHDHGHTIARLEDGTHAQGSRFANGPARRSANAVLLELMLEPG